MPNPKKANLLDKLYRAYKEKRMLPKYDAVSIDKGYREAGFGNWRPKPLTEEEISELPTSLLFSLNERNPLPEYGLEISRRHNKMVEENKKNFPYLFGEQTEK